MDHPNQRVLIAGAGDLGLAVARQLLAAGTPVATLNRSGRSLAGASPVAADLGRPDTLNNLPATDTVILTVAPPTPDEAGYRLAYLDGPQNLLDALPQPVSRVLVVSTTGVYGEDAGRWVTATSPTSPTRATAEIVLAGEQAVSERLPTTIVRATGIYGPGRTRLIEQVRLGHARVAPHRAPHWTNRIHRDDLASAVIHLTRLALAPPIVIATDNEPAPRDDVYEFLADRLGQTLAADDDTSPTPTGKRCSNDLLIETGWQPRYPSYREGYESVLANL